MLVSSTRRRKLLWLMKFEYLQSVSSVQAVAHAPSSAPGAKSMPRPR